MRGGSNGPPGKWSVTEQTPAALLVMTGQGLGETIDGLAASLSQRGREGGGRVCVRYLWVIFSFAARGTVQPNSILHTYRGFFDRGCSLPVFVWVSQRRF